jgi:hypothetical protein
MKDDDKPDKPVPGMGGAGSARMIEPEAPPAAEEQPQANGQAGPQGPVDPRLLDPQTQLLLQCFQILSTVMRGIAVSYPGINGADLLTLCSRATGMFIGTAFHGPLMDVLARRRQCREAFLDGLAKSPAPPPDPAVAQQMTKGFTQAHN